MKRSSGKSHIHTIVLGKKQITGAFLIAMAIIIGCICGYLISDKTPLLCSKLTKLCCENMIFSRQKAFRPRDILGNVNIGNFMEQSSPMFASDIKFVPASAPKQEEYEELPVAPKTPEALAMNISRKSAPSINLEIKNQTSYTVNAGELVQANVTYNASGSSPKVLVMHTHGCETYSDASGAPAGDNGSYRTCNTDCNVTALGKLLTSELNLKGINAIHDATLCDYPSYNSAYVNSKALIEKYIQKYPSLEFVFDIHRDAVSEEDGSPVKLTSEIENKTAAQVMIVCGTDGLGLYHPYWRDNLTLALKIQKSLEDTYPGLMRPLNLRNERFNMHETKGSLIFEIGTHGNTFEEAQNAILLLAEGIAATIAD